MWQILQKRQIWNENAFRNPFSKSFSSLQKEAQHWCLVDTHNFMGPTLRMCVALFIKKLFARASPLRTCEPRRPQTLLMGHFYCCRQPLKIKYPFVEKLFCFSFLCCPTRKLGVTRSQFFIELLWFHSLVFQDTRAGSSCPTKCFMWSCDFQIHSFDWWLGMKTQPS